MPALRAGRRALRACLSRSLLSLCLAASAGLAFAQETIADEEADREIRPASALQEEPGAEGPPATQPPEIPETFVPGRPGVFPANPLPDDVAITPTRTETRIGQTGTALTVISQDEIRESGQSSVAEVIRGKVGVDVVRSGGPGQQTSLFIRGANSFQTKVLLDGMPLNDPSSASRAFDFSTLDVENIERIEVLRGPQSLLYGSDAMGGVVNIVTKRGDGPATARVSGLGGSFATGRVGASVSGGDELKYYSLGGSYLETDGISAASERLGNTEKDGFKNGTLSGRFGITASDQVNVDYVFRYTDSDTEIDNFNANTFIFEDDLTALLLQESFFNRVQMQSLFANGGIEQIVAFSLADFQRRDTSIGPFVVPDFAGQSRVVDYQLNFLLTDANTLTAGGQYYAEDASDTFTPARSQNYTGIFLQDQWQILDNWFASAGARWDDHSRAGRAETYRATSLYTIIETDTDLHGSIGTGFRAPALAELAFAAGNLNPENSKGWDIGGTQRLFDGRVSADATYFRNDFDNLVDFNFQTFLLENIGRARTSGVEVTLNLQATEVTNIYAFYTHTDAINLDTGLRLVRRPREKFTVGIDRYFWDRGGKVGAQVLFVGERPDVGAQTLAPYALVNLNGSLLLTQNAELFARIDNAFDERYEEVAGLGTPGIGGYAGLNLFW